MTGVWNIKQLQHYYPRRIFYNYFGFILKCTDTHILYLQLTHFHSPDLWIFKQTIVYKIFIYISTKKSQVTEKFQKIEGGNIISLSDMQTSRPKDVQECPFQTQMLQLITNQIREGEKT